MIKALSVALVIVCLFLPGCDDTDIFMAAQAGIDAVRAATLSDEDVKRLALKVAQESDRTHAAVPPGDPRARRLKRLVQGYGKADGYEFDYRVYRSPEVNAFAMANGSIRIYSGLMDMLDDRELQFVIGHEMGHVVEKHIKEKIRLAYVGSAARKAMASQQNEVGQIARSGLGAFAEGLLNAQFSQKEEREADDYGAMLLKEKGHGVQPAVSALTKLAALGSSHSFLSTHPAPQARAERLREGKLTSRPPEAPSLLDRVVVWLKALWPFTKDMQA